MAVSFTVKSFFVLNSFCNFARNKIWTWQTKTEKLIMQITLAIIL